MTRLTELRPEFVTFAPAVLEPGVLYVSMEYATVLHLCCCGCGNKVVTPLQPERWHLMYDGRSVSLDWSIGNWSFPCQSHYWIEGNAVIWDRPITKGEIAAARAEDRRAMQRGATKSSRSQAGGLRRARRSARATPRGGAGYSGWQTSGALPTRRRRARGGGSSRS